MSNGLERARALAKGAQRRYAKLKAEAEARVVRWEWASFAARSYKPAHLEISKTVKGKPLAAEPVPPVGGSHGYGLDAEGRVVIELQQTSFPGRYYETFFVHEPDGIASFHFSYDEPKRWINAEWLAIGDAGVTELHSVYARGNAISTIYERDELGRVVRARRSGDNPPYGALDDWRELEYDGDGQLVRVYWCQPDGRRSLDFERASEATSLPTRWQELLRELSAAVLQTLRDRPPPGRADDPLYTLAFFHTGAAYQHRLPPDVAGGRLSACERLQRELGEEAPESIWNPPSGSMTTGSARSSSSNSLPSSPRCAARSARTSGRTSATPRSIASSSSWPRWSPPPSCLVRAPRASAPSRSPSIAASARARSRSSSHPSWCKRCVRCAGSDTNRAASGRWATNERRANAESPARDERDAALPTLRYRELALHKVDSAATRSRYFRSFCVRSMVTDFSLRRATSNQRSPQSE